MAIDDVISPYRMLDLIGEKLGQDAIVEDVQPEVLEKINLSSGDVDFLYLATKKMQRGFHGQTDDLARYYSLYFSPVENTYLSKDMKGFVKAMSQLAISIYAD